MFLYNQKIIKINFDLLHLLVIIFSFSRNCDFFLTTLVTTLEYIYICSLISAFCKLVVCQPHTTSSFHFINCVNSNLAIIPSNVNESIIITILFLSSHCTFLLSLLLSGLLLPILSFCSVRSSCSCLKRRCAFRYIPTLFSS